MKITILTIGKEHDKNIVKAIEDYCTRLKHYTKLEWNIVDVPTASSMNEKQVRDVQSEALLGKIKEDDLVILLDENGTEVDSVMLAKKLQGYINRSTQSIVFIIGGAYGVNNQLTSKAHFIWSLSRLVFPHQLVRLILAEQLYRAHTIMAGEKYHHK